MRTADHRQVRAICEHVLKLVDVTKGTAKTEVSQQSVVRLRASLRKGRFREAENLSYGILMEREGFSTEGGDEEAAESHETSKAPTISVGNTVNIGRGIRFVRVAAGIRQGEMARRLEISQNYLSLLENNKAEPSLALLKKVSAEFNVPVSFLLLESSVDFESENPEANALLKELKELIHQLQDARIKDKEGQVETDGAGAVEDR